MIINDEEYRFEIEGQTYHCALDVTMSFVGGKWKSVVLWYLVGGKKRFGELKKRIPNITEKMLANQLRAMEEDGFVKRTVYAEVPPRVEYELTEQGETLVPLLQEIAKWGKSRADQFGKLVKVEK